MSSISSSIISQAKAGDAKTITQLLNAALAPKNITVRTTSIQNRLTIFAQAELLPDQESLIGIITRGFRDLEINTIESIKVYGKSFKSPEDSWADEITFFPNGKNNQNLSKGSSRFNFSKTNLLSYLTRIHSFGCSLLSNKRFVIIAVGFILAALVTSGGAVGFKLFKARLAQAEIIQDAQTLVKSSQGSEIETVDALQNKLDQLREARKLLRSIPNSPTSLHDQANTELRVVSQSIDNVESKMATEKTVADKLSAANEVAGSALSDVIAPPYPIETWNQAKIDLTKAIDMLNVIPQEGALSGQITAQIKGYKGKVEWINKAIANETIGVEASAKADEMAQSAYNFTNGRSKFETTDLQKARDLWAKAITQIKTVPPTTHAYRAVSDRLDTYTYNSNEILDAIYEIQNCLKDSTSQDLKELCKSVYLSTKEPSDDPDYPF